jgi:hypothetical protein
MGHMKFPLPTVLEPVGTVCIQVEIPDDLAWRAAFWGNFRNLLSPANHGDDDAHTALTVAARWLEIFNAARESECSNLDVRQNPTSPCILEKAPDGVTWEQFANLRLCAPQIRMVGTQLQYSTDGGVTWQTYEPGNAGTDSNPPPPYPTGTVPPGQSALCLSATNVLAWFQDLIARIGSALAGTATYFIILTIVIAAVSLLLTGFTDAAVAAALVLAVLQITSTDWNAAFTSTVWADLLCILYCNSASDGSYSQGEFDTIRGQVEAKTGTAWDIIGLILDIIGKDGLTWAAGIRTTESADCSSCDCVFCFKWDFTESDGGFVKSSSYGVYTPSTGWQTTLREDNAAMLGTFERSIPSTYVNELEIQVLTTATDPYPNQFLQALAGATVVTQLNIDVPNNTGVITKVLTVNAVIDKIRFNLDVSATPVQTGLYVIIRGTGSNPFGSDNCT